MSNLLSRDFPLSKFRCHSQSNLTTKSFRMSEDMGRKFKRTENECLDKFQLK